MFLPALALVCLGAGSHVIILSGGTSPQEADDALQRFAARQGATFFSRLGEGFPRAVASASIEGLKPGFQIAILGFCSDKAAANRAREVANLVVETGVYVRPVTGTIEDSCPQLTESPPPKAKTLTQLDAARGSGLKWVVQGKTRAKDGWSALQLSVQLGRSTLATAEHLATTGAVENARCEVPEPLDLGGKSVLLVRCRYDYPCSCESCRDGVETCDGYTNDVYAYACGTVKKVLSTTGRLPVNGEGYEWSDASCEYVDKK